LWKTRKVGYFVDPGIDVENATASYVFLISENNDKTPFGYNPTYGHFSFSHEELENLDSFLGKCTEIDVGKYKELTKGYDTPEHYLVEDGIDTMDKKRIKNDFEMEM